MGDKLAALPFMFLATSNFILFFILDFRLDRIERKLEKGSEMNNKDIIYRQAAIQWVKTECNPYGNPTLDFESGKKVIEHLEQMPSAQPEILACGEGELNVFDTNVIDCSDCIKHGGDWDCDHVHCHKGKSVQPKRKGKWIVDDMATEHCSVCKHRFYISALFAVGGNDEPPCCPNCGVRME